MHTPINKGMLIIINKKTKYGRGMPGIDYIKISENEVEREYKYSQDQEIEEIEEIEEIPLTK